MSKGFGKKALLHNKKGSKANSHSNSPSSNTKTSDDDDKLMVKFVFEGEKFHARTPICFDTLNLSDLLSKISLDVTLPPPSAQELFESYFKEDIYPYIRHNIQSQIRNKRDVTKLWELQSNILQNIYEDRATLLRKEWNLRRKNKQKLESLANSINNPEYAEQLRKKNELKAKNKAKKKNWQQLIAEQIASGQFDDDNNDNNNSANSHKNNGKSKKKLKKLKKIVKKKEKTKSKPQKIKKKKLKKWKDKKDKKIQEIWPAATVTTAVSGSASGSGSGSVAVSSKVSNGKLVNKPKQNGTKYSVSVAEHLKKIETQNLLKEKLKEKQLIDIIENDKSDNTSNMSHSTQNTSNTITSSSYHQVQNGSKQNGIIKRNRLILSHVSYKLLVRGVNRSHLVQINGSGSGSGSGDEKQIAEIIPFISNLDNNLIKFIKIWIYMDSYKNNDNNSEIWLNTDANGVKLSISNLNLNDELILFKVCWGDFGIDIKNRIDSNNIDAKFVKKSKALKLKIPILS